MEATSRVRLVNDPMRIGDLTGKERERRGRILLQVRFPSGTQWIPKDQIEVVTEDRMDPLDLLQAKKLGTSGDLRRALTHVRLTGRLSDVIYSMRVTNTDFYAYQFKPVLKLLQSPTNGILVADEVGLGKTIEAGLAWTELRSRFDMRRILVLCPAALRPKWKFELASKIGVDASICNAQEVLDALEDEDLSLRGFAVIASIQGLRPPKGWKENKSTKPAAKLARYLRDMEHEERLLDLLVIDEAHHLRTPETQTNELGHLMRNVADYALLLSATPIHNRNEDLFSLLRLLDPDTFTHMADFTSILNANAPLVRARDRLLRGDISTNDLMSLLKEVERHPLLKGNRQLELLKNEVGSNESIDDREKRSHLAYRLESVNLLAHVVTRMRKRDVKEWRVVREPHREFVEMSSMEEEFYRIVTQVVTEYAQERDVNERFLLATPQRQMASCMPAALKLWLERKAELAESEETGEEEDNERRGKLGPLTTEIVLRAEDFVDLKKLWSTDSKYARFQQILTKFLSDHADEKIVVFSTFRATLSYLHERLSDVGISSIMLRGGERPSKDEIIKEFEDPSGPSVLLSSEVGGEGVDLQFARVVINYDLPWNPMRVEQRIGRLDRLGQMAEKVLIWNLFYDRTIDARIYQRLYDKLDLCTYALGDFEAILGEEIRKLTIDLLSGDLSPVQQEERIDQTAQALENLRIEEQHLEDEAAHLIAYGDYILQKVHAARNLNRWISGEDIRIYISDYLTIHYPGCLIRQFDSIQPIYDVRLSVKAKNDLDDYIHEERIHHRTRLTLGTSRPIRCKFENRVTVGMREREEIVSQFHPLVRFISTQITDKEAQLRPAVAVTLSHKNMDRSLKPGVYAAACALWSISGVQDSEKLVYAAIPLDSSDSHLGDEDAERLVVNAATRGKDWLEARNTVDLERIHDIANDALFGHLDEKHEKFEEDIRAQNEDRADIQARTLERHLRQQKAKLEEVRNKHLAFGRDGLAKATEGRIEALQNKVERQRLKISNRRNIMSRRDEICVAIINVVG